LKENSKELKEGKVKKDFINLNADMTSRILATNVEGLDTMQKIAESRKRLKVLT